LIPIDDAWVLQTFDGEPIVVDAKCNARVGRQFLTMVDGRVVEVPAFGFVHLGPAQSSSFNATTEWSSHASALPTWP